jgi:hypothetical protein
LRKNEASAPWSLAREPRTFFRRGESDGWRNELSADAIATIEAALGKWMSTYGYQVQERRTVRQTLSVQITQSSDRARDFLRRRAQGLAERLR